eukprot:TRINITY_DN128_c0_g1_i1.p1 TRINITY_DN128_c0_g1~~TRINITY_DN128_c0_g1_i1.p1  ORF type:complete len:522 (-),score=115.74 TRINITY_DN128_c0_g1_i1:130-1632(-)
MNDKNENDLKKQPIFEEEKEEEIPPFPLEPGKYTIEWEETYPINDTITLLENPFSCDSTSTNFSSTYEKHMKVIKIFLKGKYLQSEENEPISIEDILENSSNVCDIIKSNCFCDYEQHIRLNEIKKWFDEMKVFEYYENEYKHARNSTDPFNLVKSPAFMNRNALILASIDKMTGLVSRYVHEPTLYFLDLCGAPGGWTEYISWKRYIQTLQRPPNSPIPLYGVGITLRTGSQLWEKRFFNLNVQTEIINKGLVELTFGKNDETGLGDGDIRKIANINYLGERVQLHSEDVHLIVADGGSETSEDYHMLEIVNFDVIVYEIITGLMYLKEEGCLLVRMFDIHLPLTQTLIFLLSLVFRRTGITKPYASRKISSDIYILFDSFMLNRNDSKENDLIEKLIVHLRKCVILHNKYREEKKILRSVTNFENIAKVWPSFQATMTETIDKISEEQLKSLENLKKSMLDPSLSCPVNIIHKTSNDYLQNLNIPLTKPINVRRKKRR